MRLIITTKTVFGLIMASKSIIGFFNMGYYDFDSYLKGLNHLINCAKMKLTHKSILLATVALLPLQVSAQMHGGDGGYAPAPVMAYLPPPLPAPVAAVPNIVSPVIAVPAGLGAGAPVTGGEVLGGAFPVAPVVAPQPTGINKILIEKYGWNFVDGTAYAPGMAPAVSEASSAAAGEANSE